MSPSSTCQTMDHLSELPDALIILILSLLRTSDVVKTMILSKRWVHLWKTVPCLEFHPCHLPMYWKNLDKYPDFVKGALTHWKGSKIQKFILTVYIDVANIGTSIIMLDSYLLFAIEKHVEELHVCASGFKYYCPPQSLYSCSSITKMSISDCELRIDVAVQWNGLKSLILYFSRRLSEYAIHRILAGAPLLEELILHVTGFYENLSLQSTCLKKLKFGFFMYEDVLNIWAPNLLDLEISGNFNGTCLLEVPSLTNAKISFKETFGGAIYGATPPVEMFNQVFQSIRHVEKLTLSKFSIKTLLRMKHNGFLIEFSNAKSLYLYPGEAGEMLGVLDMFPNLTKLWVQLDQDAYFRLLDEAIYGIDSDLSKEALPSPYLLYLQRVEITWYPRDASTIRVIEILLQNAHLLEKLVFRPKKDRELWVMVEEKLLRLPRSSPTAELIVIKD